MADIEKDLTNEDYDLDEDYESEEEIVTFHDGNTDKDVDFRVVVKLIYEGEEYAFMSPVEPYEDFGEDEVLICAKDVDDDGSDFYSPVEDEALMQAVYDKYVSEFNAANGGDGKKN